MTEFEYAGLSIAGRYLFNAFIKPEPFETLSLYEQGETELLTVTEILNIIVENVKKPFAINDTMIQIMSTILRDHNFEQFSERRGADNQLSIVWRVRRKELGNG